MTVILKAFRRYSRIESLSIDSLGVDYVLMWGRQEVLLCYAYRDSRTETVITAIHEKAPFSELYCRTGCQFQPFDSVYQLCDDLRKGGLAGVVS